jgi:hypothetical protein
MPMAFDVGDQPTEPPDDDGEWVVAVSGTKAAWVWLPAEDEASTKPTPPGQGGTPPTVNPTSR